MLREYTASFTSVKPCLYQPPPGTVIEVAPRPVGVKLHVPARSTEAIAAFPAAEPSTPAAATPPAAICADRAGTGTAMAGLASTTAAASPPAAAANQPPGRTFERRMTTSCGLGHLRKHGAIREADHRTVSAVGRHHRPAGRS